MEGEHEQESGAEERGTQEHGATEAEERSRAPKNVSRGERIASLALGGLLLAWAGRRRRSPLGAGLGALGVALAGRGVTGRCAAYRAAGIDTAQQSLTHRMRAAARKARGTTGGVEIEQALTVNRPADKVYEAWRRLERLPEILHHVESVHESTDGRTHWVAAGPFGTRVEWDAEITEDRPGQRIAWRSLPGSAVENEGCVSFEAAPAGRGTELKVRICYRPLAGEMLAPVLRKLSSREVREDLRCFKQWIEAGEVPTTENQPHGRKRDEAQAEASGKTRPGAHTMRKVRRTRESAEGAVAQERSAL